ncbi:DUF4177 domain-containing protein [Tenacibaculum sp. M341]|uniref:DUF4177 domain-containing protein n=1 Tax=Tenacibaculum sp. M341 TaxID=2530339 RepID=UPI00104BF85F|nr:DUF4177 domain-containing protein [Tenacibaculum sp. M341]TCI91894.1 DUF4177 domain-containing protein [Tenacibaculum sp. M341]
MKEYKVVMPKLGFSNRLKKYEDFLNQYAREGWVVNHVSPHGTVVFERDKNR